MPLGILSCHEHRAQGAAAAVEGSHSPCTRQKRGKEEQELWHRQVKGQTSIYV